MEDFFGDLRYTFRLLIKNPGFTFIAVLALAIGIGANSAVFSVVNALLLQPFPFQDLDRLVSIRESLPNQSLKATAVSPADFLDFKNQNTVFQNFSGYRLRDITLTGSTEPELVRGSFISSGFLAALKQQVLHGRDFLQEESQEGKDQVAILSYSFWQRRFGGNLGILGHSIILNSKATIVIGVMQPQFDFPFGTDVWLPLMFTPEQKMQREIRNVYAFARLKDGVSVKSAEQELIAIAKRIEQLHPSTNAGLSVSIIPLRDLQADFTRPMMTILIGMASFLLLIACANVMNLILARATVRKKEIAIRAALSASRWRVVRQLMTEGLVLSFLGGALGFLLAIWSVDLIKASLPPDIAKHMAGWKEMGVNGRVLAFTIVATFVTTNLFSLIPALQVSRADLNEIFKEGSRNSVVHRRGTHVRNVLVGAQVALALVLLAGAGLLVKGFFRVLDQYQGTNPEEVLTIRVPLPESKYESPTKIGQFYQLALERVRMIPGIQAATISSNTPLNNSPNPSVELLIEGRPSLRPDERHLADLVIVAGNYFQLVGAPLLKGRDFDEGDRVNTSRVAIISQLAAERYWPGQDPLGKRFKRGTSADGGWITIVGIAGDVRQSWFDKGIRPQIYLPYQQSPRAKMTFLVRSSNPPLDMIPAVRSQILAVDKDQPVDELKTLRQLYLDEASPMRFASVLMLVFGAVAFVLSMIGVYGVMTYSVAQRKHEIGIRNALGACKDDLLRMILLQGSKTTIAGLIIGFPLALALSKIMSSALFGLVTLEYQLLFLFMLLLIAVSLVSIYIPANRASRVDPMIVLRQN